MELTTIAIILRRTETENLRIIPWRRRRKNTETPMTTVGRERKTSSSRRRRVERNRIEVDQKDKETNELDEISLEEKSLFPDENPSNWTRTEENESNHACIDLHWTSNGQR